MKVETQGAHGRGAKARGSLLGKGDGGRGEEAGGEGEAFESGRRA